MRHHNLLERPHLAAITDGFEDPHAWGYLLAIVLFIRSLEIISEEIGIHAVRGDDIVGDHTVIFIGNSQRIELRHQAHSREIFMGGAVMAAKWVVSQKKGVVYEMSTC